MTKRISGIETHLNKLHGCKVEWIDTPTGWKMEELPDTEFVLDVDMVILAMGFTHVVHDGFVKHMNLELDDRGNLAAERYQTSDPQIFAAGDAVSGASLVVRAIESGRAAATAIDEYLKDASVGDKKRKN